MKLPKGTSYSILGPTATTGAYNNYVAVDLAGSDGVCRRRKN